MSVLALFLNSVRRLSAPAGKPASFLRRGVALVGNAVVYRLAYSDVSMLSRHLMADAGFDPDDLRASFQHKWREGEDAMADARTSGTPAATASATNRAPDACPDTMTSGAGACAC